MLFRDFRCAAVEANTNSRSVGRSVSQFVPVRSAIEVSADFHCTPEAILAPIPLYGWYDD